MNNIDTLCFSGGGVNSFCFLGVLNYAISHDIINIKNINKFIGTSGGAIVAYLLSLNYTINEIIQFVSTNDLKFIKNMDMKNLFSDYGIDKGDKFMYVLTYFLKRKYNRDDITFIELYNLTNNNLIITGTKIVNSKTKEVLFNKDNNPEMSILLALRITISVPLIFTPIYNNNNYYVDGGITNGFPYNHCDLDKTLGLYINTINYINPLHLIFYIILKPTKIHDYKYVVMIDIINKSDFDLSKNNIKYLISLGEKTGKDNIQSNFNYNIQYKTIYYNNIYYFLFAIFICFIIYKYLWEK
jgi:predicted acylesterase/phospholipase RssA